MLGIKNWNKKEKKDFHWIEWKEQEIGQHSLLQQFPLHRESVLSQRANTQSTNTKWTPSPLYSSILLFIDIWLARPMISL